MQEMCGFNKLHRYLIYQFWVLDSSRRFQFQQPDAIGKRATSNKYTEIRQNIIPSIINKSLDVFGMGENKLHNIGVKSPLCMMQKRNVVCIHSIPY